MAPQGKKAPSAKAKPKLAPKCHAGAGSSASVVDTSKVKRKQFQRRDTLEQDDRYVSRKLGHISDARLKTLRHEDGLSVHQFICAELKRWRFKQGRLASSFVVDLFKSFNLQASIWGELPDAPGGEINQELYD